MTNQQQLNRLKEPYRSQAFENVKTSLSEKSQCQWLEEESLSFKSTLFQAFAWTKTKQNFKYWAKIHSYPQNYLQDENNADSK